jgi:hypothetical protein
MHTHEVHAHETHAREMHAHEVHAHEMHAHETSAHQMYAYKMHHETVVKLLLETRADLESKDNYYGPTLLAWLTEEGRRR